MEKRILFKRGRQQKFIERVNCIISLQEMARVCERSVRTIRDWRREKFLMDYTAAHKLSRRSAVAIPQCDIREIRDQYWYTTKGAAHGGHAVLKKYGRIGGDQEYRKAQWRAWWKREGQFKPHPILNNPLPFRRPKKSTDLAEFIGIVLGDGTVAKYQIAITLHCIDDNAYGMYVRKLIHRLFDIPVGIHTDTKDHACTYAISRIQLVNYCVEKLGLKRGNKIKQQVEVPDWIKKSIALSVACLRGLVDTDGSVFSHRYNVGGKWYSYKKLAFNNSSLPLIDFAYDVLCELNIVCRKARGNKELRIDSIRDVAKYFQRIGSHNPKHLHRYKN